MKMPTNTLQPSWYLYRGADKSLARPGRKQAAATEYFEFIIIIGGILILFIYIIRPASNEIFSPSKKYIGR